MLASFSLVATNKVQSGSYLLVCQSQRSECNLRSWKGIKFPKRMQQAEWREIGRLSKWKASVWIDCAQRDFHRMVTCSDGIIELINTKSGSTSAIGQGVSAKISPNGTIIVYRDFHEPTVCHIYDLSKSRIVASVVHDDEILCTNLDDTHCVTASHDKTAKIWDFNGLLICTLAHASSVLTVALSTNYVVTGCADSIVRLFLKKNDGELLAEMSGHEDKLTCTKILERSPYQCLIFSSSWDFSVRVWSWVPGQPAQSKHVFKHPNIVSSLSVSMDGRTLLTGACDYKSRLFDLESGTLVGRIADHCGWVESVALSADGTFGCTSSKDRTVRRYDLFAVTRDKLVLFAWCLQLANHVKLPEDLLRTIKRMLI